MSLSESAPESTSIGPEISSDIISPLISSPSPRSRRVGITRPPPDLDLKLVIASRPNSQSPPHSPNTPITATSPIPVPQSPTPPSIPARSPLRPSIRYSNPASILTPVSPSPTSLVFPSQDPRLSADSTTSTTSSLSESLFGTSTKLPTPPSSEDDEHEHEPRRMSSVDESKVLGEAVVATTVKEAEKAPTPLSKRQHALLELLASERAYASDLALVKDVYIPLALGQPTLIPLPPSSTGTGTSTPPTTNGSGSSSSTSIPNPTNPMTPEDARVIFNNIVELAHFSDTFSEQLEKALGSTIEGGIGEDSVGKLFLEIIPSLERPYKTYITRQSSADEHLQNLPKTPALSSYFEQTRAYSTSVSHAWDLHSLLIKPVQRLLKYPLLLSAIIEATPDTHTDLANLKKAKESVEVIARNVNEERRRAEVVRGVLMGSDGAHGSKMRKGSGIGIGVATSVNLGKMKSLKRSAGSGGILGDLTGEPVELEGGGTILAPPSSTSTSSSLQGPSSAEAQKVENLAAELKRIETFAQQFAKNIMDWGKAASAVTYNLRVWAFAFSRVIGLGGGESQLESEAFDAFLGVIEGVPVPPVSPPPEGSEHPHPPTHDGGLLGLSADLESQINELLYKDLAQLLSTLAQPVKLIRTMQHTEPYHYHLLNMTVSHKNRPPAALLETSESYLALRGQLAKELPVYIKLLSRGMEGIVRKFGGIQVAYWAGVRDRWGELWEMLRVEGEMNGGGEETIGVWRQRWGDVDEGVQGLGVVSGRGGFKYVSGRKEERDERVGEFVNIREEPWKEKEKEKKEKKDKKEKKEKKEKEKSPPPMQRTTSTAVASVLASLEPTHNNISPPYPLSPSSTSLSSSRRARGLSDASMATTNTSNTSSSGRTGKRESTDSHRHPLPPLHPPQRPRADDWNDLFPPPVIMGFGNSFSLPRTRSMPLPKQTPQTQAQGQGERYAFGLPKVDTSPVVPVEELFFRSEREDKERGRLGRKGSLKRRVEDTFGGVGAGAARSISRGDAPIPVPAPTPTTTATAPRPTSSKGRASLPANMGSAHGPPAYTPTPTTTLAYNHQHTPSLTSTRSTPVQSSTTRFQTASQQQAESWSTAPTKYTCVVIHPCRPPAPVSYHGFPFFTLGEGERFEVLHEAGHPGLHRKLPLYVDDGEDCLLLCRRASRSEAKREVGWALASFLEPMEGWGAG